MKYYIAFKVGEAATKRAQRFISAHCVGNHPLVPTPLDRIHVTTAFLGEMEESQAKAILHVSTPFRMKSFSVNIGGLRAFQPRVLYASVSCPTSALDDLREFQAHFYHKLTGKHLYPAAYTPHLTLAKTEGKESAKQEINEILASAAAENWEQGPCYVNAIGLYTKSWLVEELELT